jgi:hypothetical protein
MRIGEACARRRRLESCSAARVPIRIAQGADWFVWPTKLHPLTCDAWAMEQSYQLLDSVLALAS